MWLIFVVCLRQANEVWQVLGPEGVAAPCSMV